MTTNPHNVLGVTAEATEVEAHAAWRRLCAQFDPACYAGASDLVRGEAARQLNHVNAAYIQLLQQRSPDDGVSRPTADGRQRSSRRWKRRLVLGTCAVAVVAVIAGGAVVYSGRSMGNKRASVEATRHLGAVSSATASAPAAPSATALAPVCPPSGTVTWTVDSLTTAEAFPQDETISPATFKVHATGHVQNSTSAAIVASISVDLYDADGRRGRAPSMIGYLDPAGNPLRVSVLSPGQSASWVLDTYSQIQQPDGTLGGAPTRIEPEHMRSLVGPGCFVTPVSENNDLP